MIKKMTLTFIIILLPIYLLRIFGLIWDPIFVILIFATFISGKSVFPILGIGSCFLWDHLLKDSSSFYILSGIIIFGSAFWLRETYPFARKPLSIILIPIYSQFLWFMLLFGYYTSEGTGVSGASYFAPFLVGNTVMTVCISAVTFGLLTKDTRRDYSPDVFSK
ncbi:hypothetical protein KKB99_02465 [bacterium]|nr:hypothetical protein [bacterium]MBU1024850.1 hypothetical protein [bacterium]